MSGRMPWLRAAASALTAVLAVAPLPAQSPLLLNRPAGGFGVDFRYYNFEEGFGFQSTRQIAVPFAVAVPVGRRLTFDVGGAWASTTAETPSGDMTIDGLTDTQLRASYVFGSDALVASLSVNLPTGKETTTQEEFIAGSAVASNFLLFPVNTYGNGTSVTGGLAGAVRAGDWNLGAAVSGRWNDSYEPFSETGQTLEYSPGIEGRLRLGVDRLVGRSRLMFGFTVSTFGDDEFAGSGTVPGRYSPGTRFIGEANYTFPAGPGQLQLFAWDYYRREGNSSDGATGNKENILTVGVSGGFPVGRLSLDPVIDARFWSPQEGSGYLVGGQVGLRIPVGTRGAVVPALRYDHGSIKDDSDTAFTVYGIAGSVFLRYSL